MSTPQKNLPPRECDVCGKSFLPYRQGHRLCSVSCRFTASQERKKKFHAANPDAISRYRKNMSPEARERLRYQQVVHSVKHYFGITLEEYEIYMDRFGRRCALCGSTDQLNLDHDHKTNRIRGVLCGKHNRALGMFGDDEFGVWELLQYLLTNNGRPDWDSYFLWLARMVSIRADCCRCLVGSVLVDEDHTVLGVGYNGSEPGGPSCRAGECPRCASDVPSGTAYESCIEIHSEDNCLRNSRLAKGRATIYITRSPCSFCESMLREAKIAQVVWPNGWFDLTPPKMG